jgi:hypothetical protein
MLKTTIEQLLIDNKFKYKHNIKNECWYSKGMYTIMYNPVEGHCIIYCINDVVCVIQNVTEDKLNEQIIKL